MFKKENRRDSIIVITTIFFTFLIFITTILGFMEVFPLKKCNVFSVFILCILTALNGIRFLGNNKKAISMFVLSGILLVGFIVLLILN